MSVEPTRASLTGQTVSTILTNNFTTSTCVSLTNLAALTQCDGDSQLTVGEFKAKVFRRESIEPLGTKFATIALQTSGIMQRYAILLFQ